MNRHSLGALFQIGSKPLKYSTYQNSLGYQLEYELMYSRVIVTHGDMSYNIENISMQYDMVTQGELAPLIRNQ